MKFQINFEHKDGTEDSFIIEAETIEGVREQADAELKKRGGVRPWSKEL